MPETVFKTVVAAHVETPCPKRRKTVAPDPETGRDRSMIYHDTPTEVPVKYHDDARYYRRRLIKGDLVEAPAQIPKAKVPKASSTAAGKKE